MEGYEIEKERKRVWSKDLKKPPSEVVIVMSQPCRFGIVSGEGLRSIGHAVKTSRAIITALTEVLNNSLENVAHSFVSKAEMQRSEMVQDSNLSKFKAEE